MAVEDKYVSSNVNGGKLEIPALSGGDRLHTVTQIFEIAAADDNNSVYRLATLPATAIITEIRIFNDAITGGTDFNLGIYEAGEGKPAKDDNIFGDAIDLSSANSFSGSGVGLNGLENLDIADANKNLRELTPTPDPIGSHTSYDIALTGITVGTAAGTVRVVISYVNG